MSKDVKFESFDQQLRGNIRDKLLRRMEEMRISYMEIAHQIKDRHGFEIEYTSLNKKINGKQRFTVETLVLVAEVLNYSIDELLLTELPESKVSNKEEEFVRDNAIRHLFSDEHLLTDPIYENFQSVMGKYYCYFWPTASENVNPHVGEMEFVQKGDICKAYFTLHTGRQVNMDGDEYTKKYEGILTMAKSVEACFCVLRGTQNVTTGELCFLAFRCFHFNKLRLFCAIAEAVTISAGGGKRVPTAHRMLLCRNEIQPEHFEIIMPLLNMNTSRFIIPTADLSDLSDFSGSEKEILGILASTRVEQSVWCFTEKEIRGFAQRIGLNDEERAMFISKLRKRAKSERYNKASTEANDIIWKVLNACGYSE